MRPQAQKVLTHSSEGIPQGSDATKCGGQAHNHLPLTALRFSCLHVPLLDAYKSEEPELRVSRIGDRMHDEKRGSPAFHNLTHHV